jgi:hypothetical protein
MSHASVAVAGKLNGYLLDLITDPGFLIRRFSGKLLAMLP